MRHLLVVLLLSAPAATAQGAASDGFVVVPCAFADGGAGASGSFAVTATLGPAPAAAIVFSPTYAFAGGFAAGLDVPIGPTPHLTGIAPRFATMRGAAALAVRGTGLIWGTTPQLAVGGVPASITTRTNALLAATLPDQPAPGWQPIAFTSGGATTVLARGIGVLPLIETEPAFGVGVPAELVYRGSAGDVVVWALALATIPPVPLLGLGHGLALDPGSLVVGPAFVVADPGGELRVPIPALAAASTFFLQAAVLSLDPGYTPGAFTNALRVF